MSSSPTSSHFNGKKAIQHVIEKQSQGIINLAESHGTEIPGHISAFADACRETAFLCMSLTAICNSFLSNKQSLFILSIFGSAFLLWRVGRSSWLGWSRLERLHRVVEEERWEIEHQREQEREELMALYRAKGFTGKLLDDVVDVLMADGDRLLRVMLEEELGLNLESHEHPLKQGFWAGIGVSFTMLLSVIGYWLLPSLITMASINLFIIAFAASLSAKYEKNKVTNAVVWNLGIAIFAFGTAYFLLEYVSL